MTRFFVNHPVTTWMIFIAFVILGSYSLPRLQIEAMPEVDLPTLTIQTIWNNASPQAIQRSITIPIEEAVQKVRGVDNVKSTSSSSQSQVEVSFRRDIDLDFARVELNEQLGSVRRSLPLNAGQPQILPYIPEEFRTQQFFLFSLESSLDPNELRELAETWVVPNLIAIDGVADAYVMGGARQLIKIILDRSKLELYGITPDEVFAALDRLDDLGSAGAVRQDGLEKLVSLRTPVALSRLKNAVIKRQGDRIFTLATVGDVRPDFEDPVYFIRANGRNVVQLSVEKRSGSNTIAVGHAVREALPRIRAEVPFPVLFDIDADQGKELEEKLVELVYRSLVILGLLFLLLAASLQQIKLTTIITGSIIFATVISLSLFYFFRISVNFITISGLAVCFGIVLDNSILVLDSIHRRLTTLTRVEKADLSLKSRFKVAHEMIVDGTSEVLFPILATTLTTVIVFVSFIFLSGRLALYYVPFAVSVAVALAASLFVAFGWVPVVLHDWWARPLLRRVPGGARELQDAKELARFVEDLPDLSARPPRLERLLQRNQRLWWIAIPVLAGLFAWGWYVYDAKVLKGGFWRLPDKEKLIVYMEMPSGTDISITSETFLKFEDGIMPIPNGARVRSQVWGGNRAYMEIEFSDSLLRTEIPMYYRQVLMAEADQIGGTTVYIAGFSDTPYIKGSFAGSSLNSLVKITGYNSKKLQEISERTLKQIERNRRVRNARITTGAQFTRVFQDEVVITIDRDRLAAHGLSVFEVVMHIRRLLGIDMPWSMLIDGEHEQVQLSYEDSEKLEFSDAMQTLIKTPRGESIRLSDLAGYRTEQLSGTIVRENQKYSSFLNWEYVGLEAMRQAFIKKVIEGLDLPYGYEAEEATREFYSEEEEEELTLTLVLALVLVFMLLAALFESLTLPILVMVSVPMSLLGVFLAFWWTSSTFDSSARIGLIMLFGIVVNNAILLLSRFRTEAEQVLKVRLGGDPAGEAALFPGGRKHIGGGDLWLLPAEERVRLLHQSIARATRIRLRSILLTSGTTIIGLAPLLIHFRDTSDKDIWENLALASIGGLTSSTILIVFMFPALYFICVRINWVWRAWWARLRRKPGAQAGATNNS